MRDEYEQLLPVWYKSTEYHDLVLSDDIDSLASCAVLNIVKGWKIRYFYDFNTIYKRDIKRSNSKKCWVDIATYKGRAFDNHVSLLSDWDSWNDSAINLNSMCMVTNDNYTDKYAGSTLLTVWSIYNLPLPETEEGKMLLLCVDTAYKGFYSDKFHDIQKHYLVDIMGFDELYDVIQRHTKEDFEDITLKYKLHEKLYIWDTEIETDLPLKQIGQTLGIDLNIIPQTEYFPCVHLEQVKADIGNKEHHSELNDDIKTLAVVYKGKVKYSKIKERR